ncbi:MAG: flap endonuclease-1 [Candidatus Hadarchaeum sp.]|uniref:flap endonuclease-1 n=1 Tax=Candidatus Hadarchaeum sp. TaxID=2883567 RepID=UPI003D1454AA
MGVQLGDLVSKERVELESLRGRIVAIDALNFLYQFLSIIRQRDGELLRDSRGRITSHLSGIFYRTANFIEVGIRPIYVFDGKPPALKRLTVEQRQMVRVEAEREWKKALEEGRTQDARKFAQRAGRLDAAMIKQTQELLSRMGVPWVQAPGEGEAQAALMVQRGDAWAAASQDFDSLLFGAPRLVRNLAITGRRKLPGKDAFTEVYPEIIELGRVLAELGITREQLVDIGILVGTDYNEGIKGIGPKKALELVKKYGSMAEIVKTELGKKFEVDPLEVREIFLRPEVTTDYRLVWGDPDPEAIKKFLCDEFDFSEERVLSGIDKLTRGKLERGQARLEQWFG